jgi:hypothetical protein
LETDDFQNRRGEFGTKVNLHEKESFELMPPHTPPPRLVWNLKSFKARE